MRLHTLALGIASLSGLLSSVLALQAAQRTQETHERLTVVVCDKVGITPETLRIAKTHTEQVFANAGIDLIWIQTTGDRRRMTFSPTSLEGCELPAVAGDFWAVISNDVPDDWPAEGLGFSTTPRLPPHRLYVFYERVTKALSTAPNRDPAVLLGHVVAHELGHLLLASPNHTVSGMMSTGWNYRHIVEATQGVLRFHPDEAKRIQTALQARSARIAPRSAKASVLTSTR